MRQILTLAVRLRKARCRARLHSIPWYRPEAAAGLWPGGNWTPFRSGL